MAAARKSDQAPVGLVSVCLIAACRLWTGAAEPAPKWQGDVNTAKGAPPRCDGPADFQEPINTSPEERERTASTTGTEVTAGR